MPSQHGRIRCPQCGQELSIEITEEDCGVVEIICGACGHRFPALVRQAQAAAGNSGDDIGKFLPLVREFHEKLGEVLAAGKSALNEKLDKLRAAGFDPLVVLEVKIIDKNRLLPETPQAQSQASGDGVIAGTFSHEDGKWLKRLNIDLEKD